MRRRLHCQNWGLVSLMVSALAQPFLEPALESTDAVIEKIAILSEQLRWTMFLTGSDTLKSLSKAPLTKALSFTSSE